MIYKGETFEEIMTESYGYNAAVHRINGDWHFVKNLYSWNYKETEMPVIPFKIHQVWVGSTFPGIYKAYSDSWIKFHPTWEYKLWTDDNIQEIPTVNWQVYNRIKNPAQKSDYLRYHILNEYGGLYVDTDFQCLKPFDDLMGLSFFTSVGYDRYVVLYNGLMASIPHHPITEKLIEGMAILRGGHWRTIFNETGAYYFTKKFIPVAEFNPKGVVAFPIGFFYSFPNNKRHEDTFENYVKPYSYAVHHWAVSWAKFPK